MHMHSNMFKVEREQTLESDTDVEILEKKTNIKSKKCSQCDFASSHAGHLMTQWRKVEQVQPM